MQLKFSQLFDNAPQVPFANITGIFQEEFGCPPSGPDGLFSEFEETAVASASIAQVHRARLKGQDGQPGDWVAIKVQKPAVAKQMEPDLAAFRVVTWIYEHWVFDIPTYFVVGKASSAEHGVSALTFDQTLSVTTFVKNWTLSTNHRIPYAPQSSLRRILP